MATVTQPNAQKKYAEFDEYVDYQLHKTRKSIKSTDILTAIGAVATVLIGYLLLFVVLDHWVIEGGFGYGARVTLLMAVVLSTIGWIVWKIVIPYRKSVTRLFAARAIENSTPEFQSNLVNLVDLKRANRKVSASIVTTMEKRAAVSLSHVDVDHAVDRRPLMRVAYGLLFVVVAMCLYTVFSPKKISPSIWRALFPTSNVDVATRTEFLDVKPGDADVLARTQMEVTVDLRGETPERVTLFYTTTDHRFVDEPIELRQADEDIKRFHGIIVGENGRGVLQDLTYYIVAGDARTREYNVTVIQPPSADVLDIQYEYPAYMGLEGKTQQGGHIDAWEGTNLTIRAKANMPLEWATIFFSDTEDTSQKAAEKVLAVSDNVNLHNDKIWQLEIRDDGTYSRFYRIQCRNERGDVTPEPTLYNINIRPDLPPRVPVLLPTGDLEAAANAIIPLTVHAIDPDFLLQKIYLRIEKNGAEISSQTIFDGQQPSVRTSYDFELEPLALKTGDKIAYWIDARDNRRYPRSGNKDKQPNQTWTPRQNITIVDAVSNEQVKQDLEEAKQKQEEKLEEARENANEEGTDAAEPQNDDASDDKTPQPNDNDLKSDDDKKPEDGEKSSDKEQERNGAEEQKDGDSKQEGDESGSDSKLGKKKDGNSGDKEGDRPQELSPDGEDDPEVLKKLIERQQKEQSKKDDSPSEKDDSEKSGDKSKDKDKSEGGEKQPPDKSGDENGKQADPKDEKKHSDSTKENESNSDNGTGDPEKPNDGKNPTDPNESNNKGEGDKKGDDNKSPSKSPSETKKSADGGNDKKDSRKSDTSKDDPTAKKPADGDVDGDEKPADDSPDAKQKKATGDERGKAEPNDDPNAESTKTKNKLDKKDGKSKDDKTKKDGSRDADDKTKKDKSKKDGPPNKSKKDDGKAPDDSKLKDSKKDGTKNPDPRSAKKSDEKSKRERSKRDDKQPNTGNDPKYGDPKEQKTKQPEGGETGQSKQNNEGTPSEKKGPGEDSKDPGDAKSSKTPKDGKSGEKGSDKKTNKDGSKSGGKESSKKTEDTKPEAGGGPADGKPTGKKSDSKPNKPGRNPTQGSDPTGPDNLKQSGTPQAGDPKGKVAEGSGAGETPEDGEEANLEYKKQAANLVLKRLKNELERGEVDPELLEELGWSEDDMKKYVERLQEQLQTPDAGDDSRETQARKRQFEEMLKNLDLGSKGSSRTDSGEGKRSTGGAAIRRLPVPAEYREAFDAYTKSQSKRTKAPRKNKSK